MDWNEENSGLIPVHSNPGYLFLHTPTNVTYSCLFQLICCPFLSNDIPCHLFMVIPIHVTYPRPFTSNFYLFLSFLILSHTKCIPAYSNLNHLSCLMINFSGSCQSNYRLFLNFPMQLSPIPGHFNPNIIYS